ncbi:MAG: (d)CMP kinase, partial [bacterium]|nr:(d)CMP kinase [bacterium]
MKRNKPIIAIDGPVGVGKSTVAARLAAQLGLLYIDTGAMYRAVTLQAMRRQLDMEDQDGIARMAQTLRIEFQRIDGVLHITCEGEDVSEAIRAPEVSKNTSAVADNPAVRHHLVALQQKMGRDGGVVMEGRDIATVVFPDAEIKIYLDADPEVRAQRRYEELLAKGKPVCYE